MIHVVINPITITILQVKSYESTSEVFADLSLIHLLQLHYRIRIFAIINYPLSICVITHQRTLSPGHIKKALHPAHLNILHGQGDILISKDQRMRTLVGVSGHQRSRRLLSDHRQCQLLSFRRRDLHIHQRPITAEGDVHQEHALDLKGGWWGYITCYKLILATPPPYHSLVRLGKLDT